MMALSAGQVQIRDLVLGPGTDYQVLRSLNPFSREARTTQGEGRAWNHGSWSGAEWMAEAVVDIPVRVRNRADGSPAGWLAAHQRLVAAFAPVGDAAADVELRIEWCGTEYLLYGRPRMVRPEMSTVRRGYSITKCAFVALDPHVYSGVEHSAGPVPLPSSVGGLTVPMYVPLRVMAGIVGGEVDLTNDGTAETGLLVQIDGPMTEPQLTLQRSDGDIESLRWQDLEIPDGRYLLVDTAARTAFLDGLPTAARHPGFTQWPLLPAGTSKLLLRATDQSSGTATVTWRSAWW